MAPCGSPMLMAIRTIAIEGGTGTTIWKALAAFARTISAVVAIDSIMKLDASTLGFRRQLSNNPIVAVRYDFDSELPSVGIEPHDLAADHNVGWASAAPVRQLSWR